MREHDIQDPFIKIRGVVSDTDIAMTKDGAGGTRTKEWASRSTTMGRLVPIGSRGIGVSLMGNSEDKDATITVYIYNERGPAEFVVGATFTIGGQLVVIDPTSPFTALSSYSYADTVTIVDKNWHSDKFGYVPEDGVGNDEIAWILFDGMVGKYIVVEVSALDSGLSIIPIMKYWG